MVIRIFSSATISKPHKATYSLLFLVDNKTLEMPNQSLYVKSSDVEYYICSNILLKSLKVIKNILTTIDESKKIMFYCENSLMKYEWDHNEEDILINSSETWRDIITILNETNSKLEIVTGSVLEGVGDIF